MSTPTFEVGTITGDITDGGGAAAVTVDVFNAMWKNAQRATGLAVIRLSLSCAL